MTMDTKERLNAIGQFLIAREDDVRLVDNKHVTWTD